MTCDKLGVSNKADPYSGVVVEDERMRVCVNRGEMIYIYRVGFLSESALCIFSRLLQVLRLSASPR